MAIMAGLNNCLVTKVEPIKDLCKKEKIKKKLDYLLSQASEIVSSRYKSIMAVSPAPCVPYL